MNHVLDNPIWNALTTGNASIAVGSDNAKHYIRDVAFFAGLKDNTAENLQDLCQLLPQKSTAVFFTAEKLDLPSGWNLQVEKKLLQMVYERSTFLPDADSLVTLGYQHVDAMLSLIAETNPGPFLERTLEFGNYEGIFDGDRLVAMAGQRLKPGEYTEISAVCTHPQYGGRGYAAKIINSQIKKIEKEGRKAFLHVLPDNGPARKLYEKLGFRKRRELLVTVAETA